MRVIYLLVFNSFGKEAAGGGGCPPRVVGWWGLLFLVKPPPPFIPAPPPRDFFALAITINLIRQFIYLKSILNERISAKFRRVVGGFFWHYATDRFAKWIVNFYWIICNEIIM